MLTEGDATGNLDHIMKIDDDEKKEKVKVDGLKHTHIGASGVGSSFRDLFVNSLYAVIAFLLLIVTITLIGAVG